MPALLAHKVVSALPATLEANSLYCVRVGAGFDLYVTNNTGIVVAYGLNGSGGGGYATASITLPANTTEFRATIAAPAVTPLSAVQVWLAPSIETEENDPEWLDCTQCVCASVSAGSFDVFMAFSSPQSGPVNLDYRVI